MFQLSDGGEAKMWLAIKRTASRLCFKNPTKSVTTPFK